MPTPIERFDPDSVREAWDHAADAYAGFQADGSDYYRLEFFGPAQIEACGDVRGLTLLDVGCGSGYFSRAMAERGANVTGVDLSAGMLRHAHLAEDAAPLGITYQQMDARLIGESFPPASFEMATACMSMQDMPDIDRVFAGVARVLRPGARFVTCVTHPGSDMREREWLTDPSGERYALALGGYFEEGPLSYDWKSNRLAYQFSTAGYHAPLERWFQWALSAGFTLRAFHEPKPTTAALEAHPDFLDASLMPYFAIFDLVRSA